MRNSPSLRSQMQRSETQSRGFHARTLVQELRQENGRGHAKAMIEAKHKRLQFNTHGVDREIRPGRGEGGRPGQLEAVGDLTIAGTKPHTMPVTIGKKTAS